MNLLLFFKNLFKRNIEKENSMKKYLVVGLGNIGDKYKNTRHNIGFKILDFIANKEDVAFNTKKLGDLTKFRFKGRTFILLKPNTYMNLSGKAVKYWMGKEKIPLENIIIICDDLNIPFQKLRLKPKGSAGGHNGLKDINDALNTQKYARLRFGVGDEFKKGKQIDYVLGKWGEEELKLLPIKIDEIHKAIISISTIGIERAMNELNKK
jgi:PTH1 family peptidyl-tRNA hydrolase